eukprot:m.61268 g.61268  ORF g.61268 m.61268 type:complete len:433 (+) comp7988_c0_seq3:286-1584(+)
MEEVVLQSSIEKDLLENEGEVSRTAVDVDGDNDANIEYHHNLLSIGEGTLHFILQFFVDDVHDLVRLSMINKALYVSVRNLTIAKERMEEVVPLSNADDLQHMAHWSRQGVVWDVDGIAANDKQLQDVEEDINEIFLSSLRIKTKNSDTAVWAVSRVYGLQWSMKNIYSFPYAVVDSLKSTKTLQSLSITGGNYNDLLLPAVFQNTSLRVFELWFGSFYSNHKEILEYAKHSMLERIDLFKNASTDDRMGIIVEALSHIKNLKSLRIWNRGMSEKSAGSLTTLISSTKSLRDLFLLRGKFDGEISLSLADAVALNQTLQTLRIWDCACGEKGASAFASALKRNNSIVEFRYSGNSSTSIGISSLTKALLNNETIRIFDLSNEEIDRIAIQGVCEVMRTNKTLCHFGIHSTNIGNEGCKSIVQACAKNHTSIS